MNDTLDQVLREIDDPYKKTDAERKIVLRALCERVRDATAEAYGGSWFGDNPGDKEEQARIPGVDP